MKLRQALKKALAFKCSIRRSSWGAATCEHIYVAKLSSELEPCLVFTDQRNQQHPGWKPSFEELMATDWVIMKVGAP